jgi:hypothetical protein
VLPLDCLLCDWLAGRACRNGWANDSWLLTLPGSTRQGKLRDYANENSCLIFGPDTPNTNPYNLSATPNVFDLPSPGYLFSCSVKSLDHLPIIIDTMCHSPFIQPPDHPDFRPIDWAKFQAHLECEIPINLVVHKVVAINTCIENLSGTTVMKSLTAATPTCRRVMTYDHR